MADEHWIDKLMREAKLKHEQDDAKRQLAAQRASDARAKWPHFIASLIDDVRSDAARFNASKVAQERGVTLDVRTTENGFEIVSDTTPPRVARVTFDSTCTFVVTRQGHFVGQPDRHERYAADYSGNGWNVYEEKSYGQRGEYVQKPVEAILRPLVAQFLSDRDSQMGVNEMA